MCDELYLVNLSGTSEWMERMPRPSKYFTVHALFYNHTIIYSMPRNQDMVITLCLKVKA